MTNNYNFDEVIRDINEKDKFCTRNKNEEFFDNFAQYLISNSEEVHEDLYSILIHPKEVFRAYKYEGNLWSLI
jgi:hypothetical protein